MIKQLSISVILGFMVAGIQGFAGELTNPSVNVWAIDSITSPSFSYDYSPNSRLILPEDEQFLIVQARFDIEWQDVENENEHLNYNYGQMRLSLANGESMTPVASLTSDSRVSPFSRAERETIEAREDWGAQELRWGALFVVSKPITEGAKLIFLDQSYSLKCEPGSPLHPIDWLKVEVDSTAWLKSLTSDAGSESRFPSARTQLEFENKGLFCVNLSIHALKPNVIGGENRMIFRPSDFVLKTELGSIAPYGVMGRWGDKVVRETIYNVSRKSLEELPKVEQSIRLLFKVPSSFVTGEIGYFGKLIAKVKAPSD